MFEPIDTISDKINTIEELTKIINGIQLYCIEQMRNADSFDERTVYRNIFDKIERLRDEQV